MPLEYWLQRVGTGTVEFSSKMIGMMHPDVVVPLRRIANLAHTV
jgi:hypothetical protein